MFLSYLLPMLLLHIHANRNHGRIRKDINKNFAFVRNYNIFYMNMKRVRIEILEGSQKKSINQRNFRMSESFC